LQRNKTSLHIVTSVGYSIEYYDARNNKYQYQSCVEAAQVTRTLRVKVSGLLHFQLKTCIA